MFYLPTECLSIATNKVCLCFMFMLKTLLLHNRDLSGYFIPYVSFDESCNYHKQSLRNYKNIIS